MSNKQIVMHPPVILHCSSWEAQLAILYSKARTPGAPPRKTEHPWFKDIPHVECQQAAMGAGLFRSATPAGGATVQFELEHGAAPAALAVTEFSAVVTFTTPGGHGSAVAFWDLESQRVSYHRPSGWFVPVRQGAGEHASLLLKGEISPALKAIACRHISV